MKYLISFILFLTSAFVIGQEAIDSEGIPNSYPDGVYRTYKSFLNKKPSSLKKVEARDVFRPKKRIDDPLIDNCYFYYQRPDKRIKDVFAISYEGSLFIHVNSMKKLMDKKDRRQNIEYKDSFLRVVDQGEFLYLEGYFRKGGGIGFAIGGGPISIGSGGPREELKGIIFDFDIEQFDIFRDCKDFNKFLEETYPSKVVQCDSKQVPMELVRSTIFDINEGI